MDNFDKGVLENEENRPGGERGEVLIFMQRVPSHAVTFASPPPGGKRRPPTPTPGVKEVDDECRNHENNLALRDHVMNAGVISSSFFSPTLPTSDLVWEMSDRCGGKERERESERGETISNKAKPGLELLISQSLQ